VSRGRARLARSPRLARAPATAAARTTIEFLERRSLRQVQQELAVRASVCVLIFVLNEWVHAGVGVEPDPTIRAAALTGVLLNGPSYLAARTQRAARPEAYVRMLADVALLTVGLLGAGGAAAAP
jgi:hypothetical protein